MSDEGANREHPEALLACPFCGVRKTGHPLRCHIQACSMRNKRTGGKDALGMVGGGRVGSGRNRRVRVARVAVRKPV